MTKHENVMAAIRQLTYTETERVKFRSQEERLKASEVKLKRVVESLTAEEKKLYLEILEKLGLKEKVGVRSPDAAV
jgi:hypothetical protein